MAQPSAMGGPALSFFGGLEFGRVGEPQRTDDYVLSIASLTDLLATRLKVILDRVEAKDYPDVAAMLTHGADLAHGLAAARALFGTRLQPSECLKALVYFEGGELHCVPAQHRRILVDAAPRRSTPR
ncbi:MAG: nucleotidyl transferase AbiEii/AbiGii toxin family protein [Burkholderiales bacterium]